MPNPENLIPASDPRGHKLSVEDQSRGGKASGETRRRRKKMREDLEELLSVDNRQEDGLLAMIARWIKTGDPKVATFLRDTLGEAPQINIGVGAATSDEMRQLSDEELRNLAQSDDT